MANVQEKAWESQRKALAARMSQTFPQLSKLKGYGIGTDGKIDTANAAQIFITEGLSKVYKIASVCSKDNISSCGIPSRIAYMDDSGTMAFPTTMETLNQLFTKTYSDEKVEEGTRNSESNGGIIENTDAAAFETMNGESIALFYNPKCKRNGRPWVTHYGQSEVCVNMVYDLNGSKAPNQTGKDIGFITVFFPDDPVVVAPMPVLPFKNDLVPPYSEKGNDTVTYCKNQDSNSRLPDMYEAFSILVNINLLGQSAVRVGDYWSGTHTSGVGKDGKSFRVCNHGGTYYSEPNTLGYNVFCIAK